MNPLTILLGVLAFIFFMFGFWFVAVLLLLAIVYVNSTVKQRLGNTDALLKNMPTEWQNITETIKIGRESGYEIDDESDISLLGFYTTIAVHLRRYFEISVRPQIVIDFEIKHSITRPDLPEIDSDDEESISLSNKAVFGYLARRYYAECLSDNLDALPDIEKAILVRKKQGEKILSRNFQEVPT